MSRNRLSAWVEMSSDGDETELLLVVNSREARSEVHCV